MIDPRHLLFFALRFVVLFGLLILPWPPFQSSFAAGYQAGARTLLGCAFPNWVVAVEPHHEPKHTSVDTKISLGDPRERRPDGLLPVKVITLDSRSLGWMPLAMFIALWGATPQTWTQRGKMLVAGLSGILVFIAATLLASVGPAMLPEVGWRHFLALGVSHVMIDNLWLSFVGPALIWLGCVLWVWRGRFPAGPSAQPAAIVKQSQSRHH